MREAAGVDGSHRAACRTSLTVIETWSASVRPQCVSMMPCQISLGAQHAPAAQTHLCQTASTRSALIQLTALHRLLSLLQCQPQPMAPHSTGVHIMPDTSSHGRR